MPLELHQWIGPGAQGRQVGDGELMAQIVFLWSRLRIALDWRRSPPHPKHVARARIILGSADGLNVAEVAIHLAEAERARCRELAKQALDEGDRRGCSPVAR
jgi:hypothetical protein